MTEKIGIAGDWHGNLDWAREALATFAANGITNVFHLGDFGLGWPGGRWPQYLNEVTGATVKHGIWLHIIPGNHENYDWINSRLLDQNPEDGVIAVTDRISVFPRGYRFDLPHDRSGLALGGAPSIDFKSRTEGRSWWREEMITLAEAERVAEAGHADIMFTHDAPDGGTDAVQRIIDSPDGERFWGRPGILYAREGRELMNIAFAGVQPKVFAHGHFHVCDEKQVGDTKFLSFGCDGQTGNLAILDLETLDHQWIPIL